MSNRCACLYGPQDPRCCVNQRRSWTPIYNTAARTVPISYPVADWTYRDGYNIPAVATVPYINTSTYVTIGWDEPQKSEHDGREC